MNYKKLGSFRQLEKINNSNQLFNYHGLLLSLTKQSFNMIGPGNVTLRGEIE